MHLLGEIRVQSSNGLDFEDSPRLRLVVKAETLTSTSFMAINLILQDVNDNLPRFQLQNYVAYMREAQGYDAPIIQVLPKEMMLSHCGIRSAGVFHMHMTVTSIIPPLFYLSTLPGGG